MGLKFEWKNRMEERRRESESRQLKNTTCDSSKHANSKNCKLTANCAQYE